MTDRFAYKRAAAQLLVLSMMFGVLSLVSSARAGTLFVGRSSNVGVSQQAANLTGSVVWTGKLSSVCFSAKSCGQYQLNDVIHQVAYNVEVLDENGTVIPSGSTVPSGSRVTYRFVPHAPADIYWFGTGGGGDSPNGDWVPNAGPVSNICTAKNYVGLIGKDGNVPAWAHLTVAPPAKSISGLPAGCETASDGVSKTCTLTGPATLNAKFAFGQTVGRYYGRFINESTPIDYTCSDAWPMSSPAQSITIPAQSVSHTLLVGQPDPSQSPPSTPSIAPGASCIVGEPFSLTMSATDANGDAIRYGVDWNADGTVDEFAPPTGYVLSGTQQSASRTHSTAGDKTVQVMAQDDAGLSSDWATFSFNCTDAPGTQDNDQEEEADNSCSPAFVCRGNDLYRRTGLQCSTETFVQSCSYACSSGACLPPPALEGGEGIITATPSLVRLADRSTITWTTSGMLHDSCTVFEDNANIADTGSGPVGSFLSSPVTQLTTYTLTCLTEEGSPFNDSATVNIVPVFQEN